MTQSVVPCPVLTIASWPAYRFLKRQVRWSQPFKNFTQFVVIYIVKGFGIINKAEVDVFLELLLFWWANGCWQFDLWFLCPKSSLNIWKFLVDILLKPCLENFEHYFTSVWDEQIALVWAFLALPFFGIGKKTDVFQSCGLCWVIQMCWHIECSTFTESSFRIWNGSTVIPSLPLDLLIVMLPKVHLTSHSRMSGSRWVIKPLWLSGQWHCFFSFSVYSFHLF